MKKIVFIFTTLLFIASSNIVNAQEKKEKDIIDVAVSVDDFSTLVTAIKAAELVEALKEKGPFTVFAPTNAAFGKIESKVLSSLLEPANKSKLASVLTYHVISGKYSAENVMKALKKAGGTIELTTLNGAKLKIRKGTDGIYLKDERGKYSQITSTDVMASNGVIHVIDTVVMPK